MQEFLEAGYTTLMSGGGPVPGIIELKRRVEPGRSKGRASSRRAASIPTTSRPRRWRARRCKQYAKAGIEIIKARIDPEPTPQQIAIWRPSWTRARSTSST